VRHTTTAACKQKADTAGIGTSDAIKKAQKFDTDVSAMLGPEIPIVRTTFKTVKNISKQ
jgi:hypothetical protein